MVVLIYLLPGKIVSVLLVELKHQHFHIKINGTFFPLLFNGFSLSSEGFRNVNKQEVFLQVPGVLNYTSRRSYLGNLLATGVYF